MARVHLLDDELINKIAAGEVVERAASVVKELVENAIDAGASHIRVCLKDGGRQLVQVQDDGLGMEPDDALLAVKRHTTSKLSRTEDLFQVTTMGFRGEALASISSVSRFTLQTRARKSDQGIRIQIEDGQITVVPWQGSFGTSIAVADLFYNIPARKAFMKTAAAEFAACHEYMQALALSMPQLGFTLLHNDKEIFSVGPLPIAETWPRGEQALRLRSEALFGRETTSQLLYIRKADRYARVEGLISAPGQDKGSAKYIFTFVNQRWVRDKLLRFGIMRGYHSHLMKGKFPIAFLYIDIDPALVDVNVHPAKAELRFQYGNEVQNAIALALREGLRQGAWTQPPDPRVSPTSSIAADREPTLPIPDDFDLLLGRDAGEQPMQVPINPAPEQTKDDFSASSTEPTRRYDARKTKVDTGYKGQDESAYSARAVQSPPESKPSLDRDGPTRSAQPSSLSTLRSPQAPSIKRTTMSFDAWPESAPVEKQPASMGKSQDKISPSSSSQTEQMLQGASQVQQGPIGRAHVPTSLGLDIPGAVRGSEEAIPWDELRFVGAFARCFLFFEYREQLLAVDQHAFHERVLYERLARDPQLLARTQPLLMPEVLAFSPSEVAELELQQAQFRQWGLHYSLISSTEIEITAVPSLLVNKELSSLVHALLDGARGRKELAHDVLATIACHAAVRAGEDLPAPELQTLLREAQTVDFYHNCPHGRRVFRWWKQSQVAAWFDRLG